MYEHSQEHSHEQGANSMTFQLIISSNLEFRVIAQGSFLRIAVGWLIIVFHAENLEHLMTYKSELIEVCMSLLHEIVTQPDLKTAANSNRDIELTSEYIRYYHPKGELTLPVAAVDDRDNQRAA